MDWVLIRENIEDELKIGLFQKDSNSNHSKKFVSISECRILSTGLKKAFNLIKQSGLISKTGTFRIRYSPLLDKMGLWLDFSNVEIKHLLDHPSILQSLSKDFIIELGRKKKLFNPSTQKLTTPKTHPWFQTYLFDDKNHLNLKPKIIPLMSHISQFTQPSIASGSALTELVFMAIEQIQQKTFSSSELSSKSLEIIEFGPGIGPFSFPLAYEGHRMTLCEQDIFAIEAMQSTLKELDLETFNAISKNMKFMTGDFQLNPTHLFEHQFKKTTTDSESSTQNKFDVALVNPPKSGLKKMADFIVAINTPWIIYVSCYPNSLAIDSHIFHKQNYELINVVLVDQFPNTNHYEIVSVFKKRS